MTLDSHDNLKLAVRTWASAVPARGVVLITHGLSEHAGRYRHLAQHLAAAGFHVLGYDHRHHGQSEGRPRGYVRDFALLVRDLQTVVRWVRTEYVDLPLFAFGHSLGAAVIARHVIEQGHDGIAGLILAAPAFGFPDDFSPLLRRVAPLLSRFLPTLPTVQRDRAFLSRDPAVARAWDADPLTYKGGLRTRTGYVILQNSLDLLDGAAAFTLPVLILHGTADRITEPEGSRLFYEAIPSEDKTLELYEGFWHELLNEPGAGLIMEDIATWLTKRSS